MKKISLLREYCKYSWIRLIWRIWNYEVFVDGVPFSQGSYFLNTPDKINIDHIEVVKRPSASALYGSGSNGGVIRVYKKKLL